MKLVRQPPGSELCGQACVATLGGLSLGNVCLMMKTMGETKTKIIRDTLRRLGFTVADRRKRGFPPDDVTALLFWKGEESCHWMVWHRKKYYDPIAGVFRKPPRHTEGSRVTSYLEVEFTDDNTE